VYSKGLESYRSTAADVLVYADRDARERAEAAEAARHGLTVRAYQALKAEGKIAPADTARDTARMSTDDLLVYLRAAMEDVPQDSLTRQLWQELDSRMTDGHRPPNDWS
jgi:hypothetical protein